ncbi:RHS repeat-associated core domain-containing protein [Pseudomonas fluorescens]|uniref:Teneurin-like YD-shell domain-containing protein n=1 Tax=Pseudomonas fluorescens TaxID=294 RepID=A0A5E7FRU0_PSEFL|nr:RHS repeat-associated core domain-containing protein [Pseudomonas fluorescens]VVO42029.1 hypothetical protein PS723_05955 [Pseudomonas fluorescens]
MGSPYRDIQNNQRTIMIATDRQNSVLAEVNQNHVNRVTYLAYGQQSAEQQPASRLGFNGELREQQTCWYMLGNGYRAYNPVLMRFHSPDNFSPFGAGGLNPYMYCTGDPINYLDPTGHIGVGSLLFRHLKTPVGALMATSIVTGVGGGIAQASDPGSSIGTALIVLSVAAGLGAGFMRFGNGLQKRLTNTTKKGAISSALSSTRSRPSDSPPSYDSLYPNAKSKGTAITATPLQAGNSRKTFDTNKLQRTTAPAPKDHWPKVIDPDEAFRRLAAGVQGNPLAPRGLAIRRAAEREPDGVAPAQRRRRANLFLDI